MTRCLKNSGTELRFETYDSSIEIDNDTVERCMRPIKLSKKNSLFAGSDEGAENWAAAATLIETCKLNSVDPQTYFTDLLTRLVTGWPQAKIDELMPSLMSSIIPSQSLLSPQNGKSHPE